MDFNTSLRRAIRTGKVLLGQHATEDCINEGKAQLVVVARNCPDRFQKILAEKQEVPVHVFEGSGVQLGMACGKPFMVSALAIVEPGESDILSLKRA